MNDLQTIPNASVDTDTSKDKKNKPFDLAKAFRMRYKNGLSLREIGDYFGIHHSLIDTRLQAIISLLPNSEEVETYRQNKVDILSGVEYKLVCNMLDEEKLKTASLNNVAYSFQQVATQNRLEQGLATERIDSFSVTASLDELSRRKQELMDKVMASIQPVVLDTVSKPSITSDKHDK